MASCPRCGFEQPPDQYCAQCGINMETFREKHRPNILKELFLDTRLQIFLLFCIVLTSITYIYRQKHAKIESQIHSFKNQIQISASGTVRGQNPNPSSSKPEDAAMLSSESNSGLPTKTTATTPSPPPTTADTKTNATLDTNTSAKKILAEGQNDLVLIYAEVPRRILLEIFEESQAAGQFIAFDDYQAGIISSLEKRLNKKEITVLFEEHKVFQKSQPINWFTGIKDSADLSTQIGLESLIELSPGESVTGDANTWKGNLEIQRSWREDNGNGFELVKKDFPAMFEINHKSVFFMSGFLPRRSNIADEDGLSSIPAFKILKSANFIQGRSEFIIFYGVNR